MFRRSETCSGNLPMLITQGALPAGWQQGSNGCCALRRAVVAACGLCLGMAVCPALALGDTVRLKNGETVAGEIVERKVDSVVVQLANGAKVPYWLDEIDGIDDAGPAQPPRKPSEPAIGKVREVPPEERAEQEALIKQVESDRVLVKLVEEISVDYRVDRDRILLSGFSRGGAFAYRFAMAYPQFAHTVAIFNAGDFPEPMLANRFARQAAFYLAVGAEEPRRPAENKALAEALRRSGASPGTRKARAGRACRSATVQTSAPARMHVRTSARSVHV